MDAIKNSLKSVRASFDSIPFLKFMVKAGVYVFAAGGLLWLVAGFIPGAFFLKTLFATLGRVAIVAGLLFAVLNEEELILMIASAAISVGALVVGIVEIAAGIFRGYLPSFESWFFFLLFGGLAALVFIFGDKMKEYREKAKQNAQVRAAQQAAAQQAAAAQRAQQVQLIECPNCKGPVPINVQFCSNCGAPNPAMQYQQAPPVPQAPPPAPPAAPPEAPPAAPVADTSAPLEAAPAAAPTPVAPAPPEAPAAPVVKRCPACGTELNANAAFCGQCGAKQ